MNNLPILTLLAGSLLLTLSLTACSNSPALDQPPELKIIENAHGQIKYQAFLKASDYPDFKTALPLPPAPDSKLDTRDKLIYKQTRNLKGTQAWTDAAMGADMNAENIAHLFSKPLGVTISEQTTPWLFYIIKRVRSDSSLGIVKAAKKYYARPRPFVYYKDRTCSTKEVEQDHLTSGSYPSHHSSYGSLVALILAEINPQRQNEILAMGQKYGENRVVCGFHWQSDVEAGRLIAGYINARLHADQAFMEALAKAKQEVKFLASKQD